MAHWRYAAICSKLPFYPLQSPLAITKLHLPFLLSCVCSPFSFRSFASFFRKRLISRLFLSQVCVTKMEVDASGSSSRHYPQEIDQLLEAFGSAFSIEYIASTFLQANHNVEIAGEILLQATSSMGSELHPCIAEGHSKALESGDGSSSMECVAGVTGKDYSSGRMTSEISPKNIDDFLFKMLEDGFQLDMNVTREVLSTCGYDMEKSSEALLDKPASTLGKSDLVVSKEPEVSSKSHKKMTDPSCLGKSQYVNSVRLSKKKKKDKNGIEKELLQSLFTSKRPEEPKKIQPCKGITSSGRFGRIVTQPMEDTPIAKQTLFVTPLQPSKDEDEDEDSFHVHRKAAQEHRATAKEYIKAACEAFLEGDHPRSHRLMEQADFFGRKAREADEKSLQKIVETRRVEDEVLYDFSSHEPKECVQHLRFQLVTMCGIPNIPHIKVRLGNGEGGAKDASRKRLTLKLLEKESIKWTEMEDGKVILIPMSEIEPGSLSFSKN
ncbi:hypothetical protein V2J09_008819 [Rumex salicifolius]